MDNNIEIQYIHEKCLVVFIDILGFKQLIKNKGIKKEILNFLYEIRNANSVYKYNLFQENGWTTGKIDLNIISFSDHIIISIPILPGEHPLKSEEALLFGLICNISEFISKIYWMGLNSGIILRGAIAMGEMYIDLQNNLIFGDPLVEAVEDEIKLAIYPCVILSKSLLNYIHSLKQTPQSEYYNYKFIEPSIQRDLDGLFYFHYLHLPFCLTDASALNKIKEMIENNIKNNKENLKDLGKWRWLGIYFNNTLAYWQNKENKYINVQSITLVTD